MQSSPRRRAAPAGSTTSAKVRSSNRWPGSWSRSNARHASTISDGSIARERALWHTVNRLNYVNDRKQFPAIAASRSSHRCSSSASLVPGPRSSTTSSPRIPTAARRSPGRRCSRRRLPTPRRSTPTRGSRCARRSLPTPETETERDRRFKAMHPMGATLSQECVTMMGEAMCTPLFHNQFRVPTYEDWVDHDADWSHVYDVPPPPAAASAVAQPTRSLGAQDRRAHVGPRAPAAHLPRRPHRVHPP